MSINRTEAVQAQYATADNLAVRIAFQARYSCNQQRFGPWITEQYDLRPCMRILELGCGTGEMWRGVTLPEECSLLLTDFSAGMLETAQRTLTSRPEITFQQVDAQNIPCADNTFDMVIANMMLYHVPDLSRALAEIRRVLKPGGKFYCATYGEHGAVEAVAQWLNVDAAVRYTFTLQNGAAQLGQFFAQVEQRVYPDEFRITSVDDLADYLLSLTSMSQLAALPRDTLCQQLALHMKDGVIRLPKDYGLFICQ